MSTIRSKPALTLVCLLLIGVVTFLGSIDAGEAQVEEIPELVPVAEATIPVLETYTPTLEELMREVTYNVLWGQGASAEREALRATLNTPPPYGKTISEMQWGLSSTFTTSGREVQVISWDEAATTGGVKGSGGWWTRHISTPLKSLWRGITVRSNPGVSSSIKEQSVDWADDAAIKAADKVIWELQDDAVATVTETSGPMYTYTSLEPGGLSEPVFDTVDDYALWLHREGGVWRGDRFWTYKEFNSMSPLSKEAFIAAPAEARGDMQPLRAGTKAAADTTDDLLGEVAAKEAMKDRDGDGSPDTIQFLMAWDKDGDGIPEAVDVPMETTGLAADTTSTAAFATSTSVILYTAGQVGAAAAETITLSFAVPIAIPIVAAIPAGYFVYKEKDRGVEAAEEYGSCPWDYNFGPIEYSGFTPTGKIEVLDKYEYSFVIHNYEDTTKTYTIVANGPAWASYSYDKSVTVDPGTSRKVSISIQPTTSETDDFTLELTATNVADGTEIQTLTQTLKHTDFTDSDGDGLPDNAEATLGTSAYSADSDGDGIPDGAEAFYAGFYEGCLDPTVADSNRDPDGDGLTSKQEFDGFILDDTGNRLSVHRNATASSISGFGTEMKDKGWDCIWYYGDLVWQDYAVKIAMPWTMLWSGGAKRSSRATAECDCWGYTRKQLDPCNADSDDDGVDDGTEIALGIDPTDYAIDPIPFVPSDKYIILSNNIDLGEWQYYNDKHGAGVSHVDADYDGLYDSVETLVYGTDPTLKDTDGDGLSDFDEANSAAAGVNKHEYPGQLRRCIAYSTIYANERGGPFEIGLWEDRLATYGGDVVPYFMDCWSNATNPDTDGDGLTDLEEADPDTETNGYPVTSLTRMDTDNDLMIDSNEYVFWKSVRCGTDDKCMQMALELARGFATSDSDLHYWENTCMISPDLSYTGAAEAKRVAECKTFYESDLDGDGIPNGPLDADTDGDGAVDGYELSEGSNPLDPDSIPCRSCAPDMSCETRSGGSELLGSKTGACPIHTDCAKRDEMGGWTCIDLFAEKYLNFNFEMEENVTITQGDWLVLDANITNNEGENIVNNTGRYAYVTYKWQYRPSGSYDVVKVYKDDVDTAHRIGTSRLPIGTTQVNLTVTFEYYNTNTHCQEEGVSSGSMLLTILPKPPKSTWGDCEIDDIYIANEEFGGTRTLDIDYSGEAAENNDRIRADIPNTISVDVDCDSARDTFAELAAAGLQPELIVAISDSTGNVVDTTELALEFSRDSSYYNKWDYRFKKVEALTFTPELDETYIISAQVAYLSEPTRSAPLIAGEGIFAELGLGYDGSVRTKVYDESLMIGGTTGSENRLALIRVDSSDRPGSLLAEGDPNVARFKRGYTYGGLEYEVEILNAAPMDGVEVYLENARYEYDVVSQADLDSACYDYGTEERRCGCTNYCGTCREVTLEGGVEKTCIMEFHRASIWYEVDAPLSDSDLDNNRASAMVFDGNRPPTLDFQVVPIAIERFPGYVSVNMDDVIDPDEDNIRYKTVSRWRNVNGTWRLSGDYVRFKNPHTGDNVVGWKEVRIWDENTTLVISAKDDRGKESIENLTISRKPTVEEQCMAQGMYYCGRGHCCPLDGGCDINFMEPFRVYQSCCAAECEPLLSATGGIAAGASGGVAGSPGAGSMAAIPVTGSAAKDTDFGFFEKIANFFRSLF